MQTYVGGKGNLALAEISINYLDSVPGVVDLTGWLKTSQLKDMLKDIPDNPNYQLGEIPAIRMYTPGSAGVYSYERVYYTQYNMIFEIGLLNVDNQANRDFYDQILSTFSHSEAPTGKKGM